MPKNILSVIIQNLINRISKKEFFINSQFIILDTNKLLEEILKQLNFVLKYIKDSEEEITRLNNDNSRLNSELVKVQLELMEYRTRDSEAKKRKN